MAEPADWDPGAYGRFRGLRLRPALDLLARVPSLPEGHVVDLGCGSGAVGPALADRFPDRRLTGIDRSAAMLREARSSGRYHALVEADIAAWRPAAPPALIYSNAALHWLADHAMLLPALAGRAAPGGVLAVQMPDQQEAPSHRLLREVSSRLFPDRFDWTDWRPEVARPEAYHAWLAPLGAVDIWRTLYLMPLRPVAEGHPVRHFTESTAGQRVTERLAPGERDRFLAAYDAALAEAYPPVPDGTVLFPFARLFVVLVRPD